MDDEKIQKLLSITVKLNSLTAVLYGYCNGFIEESKEVSDLLEFVEILKNTAYELYDLL